MLGTCLKLSLSFLRAGRLVAALLAGIVSLPATADLQAGKPLWRTEHGLTAQGEELVQLLNSPSTLGLAPVIAENSANALPVKMLRNAQLEQLFSTLVFALHQGYTQPTTDNDWHISPASITEDALLTPLRQQLRDGQPLDQVLRGVLPSAAEYAKLVSALLQYQSIADNGGWPMLEDNDQTLRPGERHSEIQTLRNRLRIEGDYSGAMQADPFFFGPALAEAVRQFQIRHGLLADGILDRQTRTALRVPVSQRLQQIHVNLERWRWMPRFIADRRLWVNTAGAFAQLVEHNTVKLRFRAIAGRPYRATPSLVSSIDKLVVNPAWGVPHKIAVNDLLPLQKKNKHFFAQKNIRVFTRQEGKSIELDSRSIDWQKVNAQNFSYRLRQDPGEQNSMGRIKFVFANDFNVFLHDTPNKVLFELPNRNFSSGCVRIENPFELAKAVLERSPAKVTLLQNLARPGNVASQSISLEQPLPVYLVYMTTWFDDKGLLHFTPDRYGRDRVIANNLLREQSHWLASTQAH